MARDIGDTSKLPVLLISSSDYVTPLTGARSMTASFYSKAGAAAVSLSATLSADANMPGVYWFTPPSGMVDTGCQVVYHVAVTGAQAFEGLFEVQEPHATAEELAWLRTVREGLREYDEESGLETVKNSTGTIILQQTVTKSDTVTTRTANEV